MWFGHFVALRVGLRVGRNFNTRSLLSFLFGGGV